MSKSQKSQVVETPVVEAPVVEAPVVVEAPMFTIGKIPALGSNNMHDTARTWAFLADQLADAGPLTVKELQTLAKDEYNHASFVKYAVKNGWYVETTLEAEAAKFAAAEKAAAEKAEAEAAAEKATS